MTRTSRSLTPTITVAAILAIATGSGFASLEARSDDDEPADAETDEDDARRVAKRERVTRYHGKRMGELLARLEDPDPAVRAEAIDELGELGDPWAIELLIEHIDDTAGLSGSDNWVGGHAANALVAITGRPFSVDRSEWDAWWAETERQSQAVRQRCLGRATEHNDAILRPNRWWKKTAIFQLVNYTRPHIPDCRVAVTPDGEVLVLKAVGDTVIPEEGWDAVAAFNRCAKAEGLTIGPDDVAAYARFALACWGAYRFADEDLEVVAAGGDHRVSVVHDGPTARLRTTVTVRGDGTISIRQGAAKAPK